MQKIRIDFDNPGLPQHISAVENDSQSRFFQATLYENGKAYTAPAGASYSIMYHGFGPQNQGWYDTINDGAGKRAACAVSGNVVTCEIARQALQVPGHVSIVLCVTTGKGYMLKSWPIECDCKNDRYDSTVEIQSFFYITQVTNADWTQAIQAWENLKNTIDPTLSLSGKAADAAKVGEVVNAEAERAKGVEGQIKEDLTYYSVLKRAQIEFEIGTFSSENGKPVTSKTRARTKNFVEINPTTSFVFNQCIPSTIAMFVSILSFDKDKKFLGETGFIEDYATQNQSKKYINFLDGARFVKINTRVSNNAEITQQMLLELNNAKGPVIFNDSLGLKNSNDIAINSFNIVRNINQNVKSVCHRGLNKNYPENTLPSFIAARKSGFLYVESDVRFTSDNVPVMLHDETINRTARNTDGSKISQPVKIGDITYKQALNYDFGIYKNENYKGTSIPTFEQFLNLCKKIGLKPYVELKQPYGTEHDKIYPLVEIAKKQGMLKEISWVGGIASVVQAIIEKDEYARCGLFVGEVTKERLEVIKSLLSTGKNDVFINCTYTGLTSDGIGYCISSDIPLEVNVVDDEDYILNMDNYITGVMSNSVHAGNVLYQSIIN